MHNPTKYIFAFLSLLASSCNNHHNHDTEVAAIFREWIGKELLLPNNLTFFIQNDSINPALSNPDLKIINYINSSECTSCSMKLSSWNDAMDDFNSLPDIEVELLTIINSTDKRSISNQLRIDNHFHPVAMDSAELFNKINSLPSRH